MQNSLFSYKYPNRLSEQTSTKRKPMNSFWSDVSCISSFIPHLLVGLWWDEVFNEWIVPATESQIKIQTCMRRRSMNSFWSDVDASFIKIPNWVDWGNNYRASGRRLLSLPIQCKTKRTQTIRSETPFEIKPTVFSIKSPPLFFWNSVTTSYVRGCSVWGWTTEEHCWSSCQTRRSVGRQKGRVIEFPTFNLISPSVCPWQTNDLCSGIGCYMFSN